MILLALVSGLINLSSQVVFQKVVSMIVGDLYTTFIAVSLTFIFGSAIGSYFGWRFRRYLPYIELGTGLFSLVLFVLIKGPLYAQDIPLSLVVVALLLPAIALGTHVPLYSYYLRQMRFGFVYFIYHFGAIFGLLAFEWSFTNAGSLRSALLLIASTQITLGVALLFLRKSNLFQIETAAKRNSLSQTVSQWPRSVFLVFAASAISFYIIFWAVKTQSMLTSSYRLHATSISASVFFWMAFAGLISRWGKQIQTWLLFVGISFAALFIATSFSLFAPRITDLYSGEMINYFLISFLLSCYLTFPVLFSSLIFIRETNLLHLKLDIDVASGSLNLFAGAGNITGLIASAAMAIYMWEPPYFQTVICASLAIALLASASPGKVKRAAAVTTLIIAILTMAFTKSPMKDFLFVNRVNKGAGQCEHIRDTRILSHPLTTVALYTYENTISASTNDCMIFPPQRKYVVDGLVSHNIWRGEEYVAGVSSAKYFTEPPKKSMVIGVGTGQSAWAVAAISAHTDLVEISPAVIENLGVFKNFNNDLLHRKNVSFQLKDGFSFVRDCKPGSYDLIFNTSTQPSSYNASKLYSDEFAKLASRCLGENGVLQTYFDQDSVNNMLQFADYMAPLFAHFKYVDIMLEPYPFVFASNTRHPIHILKQTDFIHESDFTRFKNLYPDPSIFSCRPFYLGISPMKSVRMSTLDQSYIEMNTIRNSVFLRHKSGSLFQMIHEYYRDPMGRMGIQTCL